MMKSVVKPRSNSKKVEKDRLVGLAQKSFLESIGLKELIAEN